MDGNHPLNRVLFHEKPQSDRAATFDKSFAHRIPAGPEFDAWRAVFQDGLGPNPLNVLELACGTGEVTRVLLSLGHHVTGIDFAEPMLERARAKHADNPRASFRLADAEATQEAEGTFDAVVCRHLVWTLINPLEALIDWHRVLKPGGRVIIADGDWARMSLMGRLFDPIIRYLERRSSFERVVSQEMRDRHDTIMKQIYFSEGLRPDKLQPLLIQAGFRDIRQLNDSRVARAQRRIGTLAEALYTTTWRKFVLEARKPL